MGSGRDKKKKAKEKKVGPVVGKGAEKTERKTHRNEEKKERRAENKLQGDEDDIDALLQKFALEEKQQKVVQVLADCPPPSARVNASFVSHITPRSSDIIMFGGEFSDHTRDKVYVYNHLYKFNTDKQRWSQIISPKGPSPRCAHQAFIHKGMMYVWGGEFSSPNQERFMHFRDLWRLDLSSHEWDQLPLRGGPSARSGHRIAVQKGRAILFGGFYDNGRDVRYFNDLWELDLSELTWTAVGNPAAGPWPAARSGCQMMAVSDTCLMVYGGYVKDKDDEDEDLEHGKAHDDMWILDTVKYTWERVKKAGMAPGPRCSFAMVPHRSRAFLFGGVSDNETKRGEDLSSDFHNDLYTFNFTSRRWFAAQLRPPKDYKQQQTAAGDAAVHDSSSSSSNSSSQQQQQPGGSNAAAGTAGTSAAVTAAGGGMSHGSSTAASGINRELEALLAAGQDKSSPIYQAAVRIQSRFRGYAVRKAYKLYQLGGVVSEILYSPAAYGLDMSVKNMPKPRARISPQVAVVGNTLWLLGGIVEVGEAEITLDDMWCLDLVKLDGWQLVKENTVGEEVFKAAAAKAAGPGSDDSEWEEASSDAD